MNVLYILDYGIVGGATKAFCYMVFQMKHLGVTPIVVTSKWNSLNIYLERNGIKSVAAGHYTALEKINFKSIRWPFSLLKKISRYYYHEYRAIRILDKQVDFLKVDLIHTNSARNTLGCRLSHKYGIPHIVHIREFGDKDFDHIKLIPHYIGFLNKYSVTFLSVSRAVQDHWNSKGIYSHKNRLMYDGVYYKDISISSVEDKRNIKLKMIIAGGVYPTKGQHLAVEAIGLLPITIRNNVTLDIVGWYSEDYVKMLKHHTEELGYNKQINFLGSRDDVHERMGNYQIGLMCSRSEGFGLVTAEYMHGQLGVIASDSGACKELIEDGRTGLLFKSGDSKDLARCIERLYNDRDLLIQLSTNARIEALQRFTAEINADNIFSVYKQLLNRL